MNEDVKNKLNDILLLCNSTIDIENNKGSFFSSGLAGAIFLMSQYKIEFETNEYDELLKEKIEEFISVNLAKRNFTYCEGITGYAWLLNYLTENQIIDIDMAEFLDDVDLLVYESALNQLKDKNHDFLHGAVGNLYYLIDRETSKKVKQYIKSLLLELRKQSSQSSKGMFWLKLDKDKEIIDLGLSHGLASKIVVFSKLIKKNILPDLVKEMLSESVRFMLNSKNANQTYSIFPNYTTYETTDISDSPSLRWCYGDLGISLALFQAGEALNDINIKDEAIKTCLKTLSLKDAEHTRIYDVGLCHGSSGAVHLYNRMYYNTKDERFKLASEYWLQKTLELASKENEFAGFGKYYQDFPNTSDGFLTGISGIGLALLSSISGKEPIWDKCLLIS